MAAACPQTRACASSHLQCSLVRLPAPDVVGAPWMVLHIPAVVKRRGTVRHAGQQLLAT